MIKSFKCAGMTRSRCVVMRNALNLRIAKLQQFSPDMDNEVAFVLFKEIKDGCCEFGFAYSSQNGYFVDYAAEELTFDQAMKRILEEPMIEPEPVFDFKFRKIVLVRDCDIQAWRTAEFDFIKKNGFCTVGGMSWCYMIEFNEKYRGNKDMPDGYWVVENDKPVWKTNKC